MKVKNIQTRLLLILLPLILMVLGVLAGVSYYLAKQSLAKSIDQTAMAVGTDYSQRVQGDIEIMISQLQDLASIQRIRSGSDKAQIVEAMTETQKRLGVFDALTFVSPDGSGISSTGLTASFGDREWFKKVIATNKTVVSDPLLGKITGKWSVVLAVPVKNNGQLTGVLVGAFSMERLTSMIKDLNFLETGYGQISDDSGMIIAHPKHPDIVGKLNILEKKINPELKLQQSELDERLINLFKAAAQSGKQSRGVYTFVDGVTRVAVLTPIDLPGDICHLDFFMLW